VGAAAVTALTARQRATMREVGKRLEKVESSVDDVREEVAEIRGLIAGVFSDKLPNRRRR
jgi:tetrahydromethanopterin S-methyltransferase subunit G